MNPQLNDELGFEQALEYATTKVAKYRHPTYKRDLTIVNGENWRIGDDLLAAKNLTGDALEKFLWNPVTGEFILAWPGLGHESAARWMTSPFDDYMRGTIVRGSKIAGFHPWYPNWFRESAQAQRDDMALVEARGDAEDAMKTALAAHGSSGWTLRFDASNADIGEWSGQGLRRW